MRVLSSFSAVPAEVGRGQLFRQRVVSVPNERIFVIASALGMPRLWHVGNQTALGAFVESLAKTQNAPIRDRLDVAMHVARSALVQACQILVERIAPDVAMLAMAIEDDGVHVSSVGAARAYIYRGGVPQRLTPRSDDVGGILVEAPVRSHMPLEPGDIILAGSVSAFSQHAVARITAILTADRETTPSTLANVLTEPAAKSGVGAAAVVIRL
ncbi:MAG: hypothetical protein IPK60_17750 [Sandaracinaceae bacterium]|nr:hypothetical protein [Sandaracinaceae bacterium]